MVLSDYKSQQSVYFLTLKLSSFFFRLTNINGIYFFGASDRLKPTRSNGLHSFEFKSPRVMSCQTCRGRKDEAASMCESPAACVCKTNVAPASGRSTRGRLALFQFAGQTSSGVLTDKKERRASDWEFGMNSWRRMGVRWSRGINVEQLHIITL